MQRLVLALLALVACTDDPASREVRDASVDARVPSGPVTHSAVSCNPPDCRLPHEPCALDSDCCQPRNNATAHFVCLGQCSTVLLSDPPSWIDPLPLCLADGGSPPDGRGPSSVLRCNPSDCAVEGARCARDVDCCQPSTLPSDSTLCVDEVCVRSPGAASEPLASCLPDGGLPTCLRGLACETDGDCCGTYAGIPLLCLAGRCDLTID